jgi:hypothetical protein
MNPRLLLLVRAACSTAPRHESTAVRLEKFAQNRPPMRRRPSTPIEVSPRPHEKSTTYKIGCRPPRPLRTGSAPTQEKTTSRARQNARGEKSKSPNPQRGTP